MGLPHFENPHLLPQTTEPATRAELYPIDDDERIHRNEAEDEEAVKELRKLLRKRVRYEVVASVSPESSKRRKLESNNQQEVGEEEEQLVLFRLVSSAKDPKLVSLLPAPSPPTLTRPPDSEDTEAQAMIRKQRSEAASIDGATILLYAAASEPRTGPARVPVKLREDIPNPPCLIVLGTMQGRRNTRPPVPPSKLLYHPYTADASPPSLIPPHKAKCLVATIAESQADSPSAPTHRRSRHRRKSKVDLQPPKARPPPQFWRPGPGMTGKCRGYAYGYPGSFLAAAEARGYVNEMSAQKYKHDTMKKGRYAE